MKRVVLQRHLQTDTGTYGALTLVGTGHGWNSVERPRTGPHPCIPAGLYTMSLGMYYGGDGPGGKKDYPAYVVMAVPGRSEIKTHIANRPSELRGCIAPCRTFTWFEGVLGGLSSTDAFNDFMLRLAGEPTVELEIRDP